MEVTLKPETESYLTARVSDGSYPDVNAVVDHALRLMMEEEAELEALRSQIDIGRAEIEAGLGIPVEEVFTGLKKRFRCRDVG